MKSCNGLRGNLRIHLHLVKVIARRHRSENKRQEHRSQDQKDTATKPADDELHRPAPLALVSCSCSYAEMRDLVYGCWGRLKRSGVLPCSTIWPCCMTAIESTVRAKRFRSWEANRSANPCSARSSISCFRIWAAI